MTKAQILIVEDERIVAKDIEYSLKTLGYKVTGIASSGEKAIQKAKDARPDLVLMDIRLKGTMDGIEAAHRLREEHSIPVVYLTAYADEGTLERAKVTGPFGYILKPFNEKELCSTIEMALYKHRIDQELRESEERYRQLVEVSPDIIIVHGDGVIEFINTVGARLLGAERPEHLVGKPVAGIMHGDFQATMLDGIDRIMKGLEKFPGTEGKYVRLDGGIINVEVEAVPITYKGKRAVQSVARDITARKAADEKLRENELRYRTLFEGSRDAIFIITREGSLIDYNQSFLSLFGYEGAEMVGMDMKQMHVDGEDLDALWRELPKSGSITDYESRLYKKDKTIINCLITAVRLVDKDGKVTGYQGSIRDITERKRLEAQFLHAQKMEAVGTLAGAIAHDFNNILTAIIGCGSLLQIKMNESGLRQYVDQILASCEKAANLTQSLLSFSRKPVSHAKPVELNGIIKRIEKLLGRLIREEIELKSVLWDSDLVVRADSGQIEQILMNLVTNAKDAMPEGGSLGIRTGYVKIDSEYVRVHGYGVPGEYAVMTVSDTGMGMDKDTAAKIFEPFFTTKEIGKGTGLGLSTVYGIVKQHNGYINVYSEPGRGSVFNIYFPLVGSKVEEEEMGNQDKPAVGNELILLAEDDEQARDLMKRILEMHGYKVLSSVDGEDALRVFKEYSDDVALAIFDVIMPKKGGKAAYEEMIKINPEVKALFMSGYTADIVERRGIIRGNIDFIQKPIMPDMLLRKVREALDEERKDMRSQV